MHCFDCSKSGTQTTAVGFCHYCGAAICPAHATVACIPTEIQVPIAQAVELPKRKAHVLAQFVPMLWHRHMQIGLEARWLHSNRALEPLRDHALIA